MIDKDKQTPYYAMGRFVALFNLYSGDDFNTQLRRVSKIEDTSPKFTIPPILHKSIEVKLADKCPEVLEIIDKINPEDIPEHFTLEQLGQFQLGYYHQQNENYKRKEENENK